MICVWIRVQEREESSLLCSVRYLVVRNSGRVAKLVGTERSVDVGMGMWGRPLTATASVDLLDLVDGTPSALAYQPSEPMRCKLTLYLPPSVTLLVGTRLLVCHWLVNLDRDSSGSLTYWDSTDSQLSQRLRHNLDLVNF
jgi:hypothetical protein